jgi:hypothetical protein
MLHAFANPDGWFTLVKVVPALQSSALLVYYLAFRGQPRKSGDFPAI